MSRVAIVKGTNPQEMTVKALEMVAAQEAVSKVKPVLVKPNYVNASHPSTGITTDGRVVEGVVKFLKQHNVEDIVIGEGSGFADTFKAFQVAGLDTVAERWKVRLADLNRDKFAEVSPESPLTLKGIKIAQTALSSTIISVPKLKLHRLARITLSLKNMMGAVNPKGAMHVSLSENIVNLASIIKPSVAVIDGVIAGEGHELSVNPVEMNLVVAGTDPVAVDAVGAALMGIPPASVKHLRLAEERGLGTCDLNRIEVLGEPIDDMARKFRASLLSTVLSRLS